MVLKIVVKIVVEKIIRYKKEKYYELRIDGKQQSFFKRRSEF